jgi:hypothetical protein
MASVSFNLTVASNLQINNVLTGTNAPGTGDVEIRINASNVPTRKEANKLIREILNYINYGDQTVFKP